MEVSRYIIYFTSQRCAVLGGLHDILENFACIIMLILSLHFLFAAMIKEQGQVSGNYAIANIFIH